MIGYLANNPEYENGCYGSAIKIVNVVSVIMMADGLVFASRNARDYARGNDDSLREHLRIAFRYVWMIGFPIIAGILVLSEQISLCVFGEGYEKVPLLLKIFTVRVLTHGIMNVIANQYLLPTGREKICTVLNFVAIAANIILNRMLIPIKGCVGAAMASIISETLLTLAFLMYFVLEKKNWNKVIILQSYKYIIASLIMCIPVILLKQMLADKWYYVGLIIIIGAIVYGFSLLALKDEMILVYGKRILNKVKG
jgi:O-antigen/teichoic acid export membrane protein